MRENRLKSWIRQISNKIGTNLPEYDTRVTNTNMKPCWQQLAGEYNCENIVSSANSKLSEK